MDTIEQVGALVGIAAFLVLAALALLFFHQAREVKRLREWAGRAPERAAAIAEREELLAESERAEAAKAIAGPSRWSRMRERIRGRFAVIGRRSPIDPLYLGAIVIGLIVAVGFVTGGFGLLGGDGPTGSQTVDTEPDDPGRGVKSPGQTDVAVLNATQVPPVGGIPGLADAFATEVTTLGYRTATDLVGDATEGVDQTSVMWRKGSEREAKRLATQLEPALGSTSIDVRQMSADVLRQLGDNTPELVLLIGRNYEPEEPAVEPVPTPVPEPIPAPVPEPIPAPVP